MHQFHKIKTIHNTFQFFFSSSSFRSPSHLQSRGWDKLERPLQLSQASPQLLPNCRPLRPCYPSQLVKEWTVLEDVAQCLLDHTGSRGWEQSSAYGTCAVSACSIRVLAWMWWLVQLCLIVIPLRPLRLPDGFDQGLLLMEGDLVLCLVLCSPPPSKLINELIMVTMAQSAADWHNMHTHMDRTHSLTHL